MPFSLDQFFLQNLTAEFVAKQLGETSYCPSQHGKENCRIFIQFSCCFLTVLISVLSHSSSISFLLSFNFVFTSISHVENSLPSLWFSLFRSEILISPSFLLSRLMSSERRLCSLFSFSMKITLERTRSCHAVRFFSLLARANFSFKIFLRSSLTLAKKSPQLILHNKHALTKIRRPFRYVLNYFK